MSNVQLPNVWVVRADGGKYTEACVKGGYTGIGWDLGDLSTVKDRDTVRSMYMATYPGEKSNYVIGKQVGQIARFLLEIAAGDYVITPSADSGWLQYGKVADDPSYCYSDGSDGCPYCNRRAVSWAKRRLNRSEFSVPLQHTLRADLTVYAVSRRDEFLEKIGEQAPAPIARASEYDPPQVVLDHILELTAEEFEDLVGHVLAARL